MYDVNTHDVRRFFADVWRQRLAPLQLDKLQQKALRIIEAHPEYHHYLDNIERYLDHNWTPEQGETNPFLHLSLHLAISEQRGIDQPRGIRQAMDVLETKLGSAHDAAHVVQECLVEALWQSQRHGRPLDGNAYVNAVRQKAGLPPMPPDYSAGPGGYGGGTGAGGNIITR